MNEREQFFYDNAGWCYDPVEETPEEGHVNTAKHLARAEQWAHDVGIEFQWWPDEDAPPLHRAYGCVAGHMPNWAEPIEVEASLWGIEFEDGQSYLTDPYAQVVEAELASEIAFQRGLVRS
jgi:hypothetical protein